MNEPEFLDAASIEEYHRESLAKWGGQDGVRDTVLLESAISQPQQVYCYYDGADLFDIAAAYCFHIAQNQAFFDGNKRTAVAAGLAFLKINGVNTNRDIEQDLFDAMIAIANDNMNREGLAILLRELFS